MKQRTRRFDVLFALVLPLVGLTRPAAALTRTFYVIYDADIPDYFPGDGICSTASGGPCTLRAAIMEASFYDSGVDSIINVPAGQYVLTIARTDLYGGGGN